MKKKYTFLLLIILITGTLKINGQNEHAPALSSAVSMVDQYAEMAGPYSGVFTYSIPIFTIHNGNITVPISLTYSTTGTRVNETPSWCGLGWNISAGGTLSRKIIDKDDYIYPRVGDPGGYYYNPLPPLFQPGYHSYTTDSVLDYSPDITYFSFLGYSGKAFPGWDKKFYVTPSQSLLMTGPYTFQDNNATYDFLPENSTSFTKTNYLTMPYGVDGPIEIDHTNVGEQSFSNSAKLGSIASIDGALVSFNYDYFSYQTKARSPISMLLDVHDNNYLMPNLSQELLIDQSIGEWRINNITFDGGRVVFVPTTKYRYDFAVADAVALDKIIVLDDRDSILTQFKLEYGYLHASDIIPFDSLSYTVNSMDSYTDKNLDYRLILTSITQLDKYGNPLNAGTKFDYNRGYLPRRDSKDSTDFWGYYNGLAYADFLGSTVDLNGGWGTPNYTFDLGGFVPDPWSASIGCLSTIIRADSSYSTIMYEGNYGNYPSNSSYLFNNGAWAGGGLRLAAIYDGAQYGTDPIKGISYEYTGGSSNYVPVKTHRFNFNGHTYELLNVDGFSPLESTGGGNMGYRNVKVTRNYFGSQTSNGETTYNNYIYTTPLIGGASNPLSDWKNGLLLSKETYDKNNILRLGQSYGYDTLSTPRASIYQRDEFGYFAKTDVLYSGMLKIHYQGIGTFDENGPQLGRNNTYTYNHNFNNGDATVSQSMTGGIETEERFLYLSNYNNVFLPNFYDIFGEHHIWDSITILDRPVEHVSLKKYNDHWYVTSGTIYLYSGQGDIDSIYSLISNPIPVADFRFSNMASSGIWDGDHIGTFSPDTHYRLTKSMRWNINDVSDGLCESIDHLRGDTIVYINAFSRFYNGFVNGGASQSGYPGITVTGASYDAVMQYYTNLQGTWEEKANQLRMHFPKARVLATIYQPMVGVTKYIDANGRGQSVEYDEANRPKIWRDNNGDITKSLYYNLK